MFNLYRYIAYALIVFTLTACGSAQPAEAATKAQSISFLLSQVRASGVALSGGKVDFYEAGATTTRKTVWIDRNKATPAANPYTLDSNGTAQLYGDGLYRIVIKNTNGSSNPANWTTVYDRDYISIKEVAGNVYDVADYASLAAAVASIGSTPATLQFAADVTITANLVIPSTLELMPLNGAKINHTIYTITVNSSTARWPLAQMFNGTGAVSGFTSDVYSEWWGAVGDGVTNCNAPIQAAVNAAASAGVTLLLQAGEYLITDNITWPQGTQIRGTRQHIGFLGGTRIKFAPTSLKNLFSPASAATLQDKFSLENVYIYGNSVDATGNSGVAISAIDMINSTFKNIRINGFRTGIRCEATINNRFEFVRIANCYIQCIQYTGRYATTDVWDQCYISNAPIGVQTNGYSTSIKFRDCIFETLDTYGVNLVKESYGWVFTDTYVEDVPAANVATNAMFRVGYDGAVLAANPQLIIQGGQLAGRNLGGVGSLLDVDFTDGVILGGFAVSRYTNVVKTTANTQTKQVVARGWIASSVTNMVTDETKVVGHYPSTVFNGGSRNNQKGYYSGVSADTATFNNQVFITHANGILIISSSGDPNGQHSAPVGSLFMRTDGGAGTTFYVKQTGTGNTGWVGK